MSGWAVDVREWWLVGRWLIKVWEKSDAKYVKWNKACFKTFYNGLAEGEKSVWIASRISGGEPASDILDAIVDGFTRRTQVRVSGAKRPEQRWSCGGSQGIR